MKTPEEFNWLFAREYRSVVRSVNLVLRNEGQAEEITQDAFVRLLEHWGKVSRYDRPGAWVRRVALRMATRAAARERRVRNLLSREREVAVVAPERDLDVWDAVRALPPRQRAVVALFYLEDMPITEVADILACSESTVSVHLHRARKALAAVVGTEVDSGVD